MLDDKLKEVVDDSKYLFEEVETDGAARTASPEVGFSIFVPKLLKNHMESRLCIIFHTFLVVNEHEKEVRIFSLF